MDDGKEGRGNFRKNEEGSKKLDELSNSGLFLRG
jgi:hypothetical protein